MDQTNFQQPRPRINPGDFFLHLGIIVALYISAISFVNLIFQIINKSFPDRLNAYAGFFSKDAVLWATAFIIIMFPLYILLGWLYNKQLQVNPEKRQLGIRRWLVYLTLFLAGLALAIDLATLVYYFLNGEITTRFILKVLTVLVVAGIIFTYYLLDVWRPLESRGRLFRSFAFGAIILVLAGIVTSFIVVGSPVSQRKLRFDQQRVNDLAGLQSQITYYWQQKGELPKTLNDLKDPIMGNVVPIDPETDAQYKYQGTGPYSFKLCGTFNLPSEDGNRVNVPEMYYGDPQGQNWKHTAGENCFERTIDPELFPPRNATVPLKRNM